MSTNKPYCCKIGCEEDAIFLVLTERDGGRQAGPDPYADDTHACEAHVGELLGWQPNAEATEELYWIVHQLGEEWGKDRGQFD